MISLFQYLDSKSKDSNTVSSHQPEYEMGQLPLPSHKQLMNIQVLRNQKTISDINKQHQFKTVQKAWNFFKA